MVRRNGEPEPADRDERLGEVIEDYLALAEAGEAPDPEEYASSHPDLRDDLIAALEGLALVQGLVGSPGGSANAPRCRLETGHRIAGYRIVRELGRGGMGVVYEAVHVGLDRPVALKVLGTHAAPDPNGRRRFLNEARTAAGLHHTHIVPVFDVGQMGGLCYYAMQRIEGSGLDRVIRHCRRDRSTGAGSSIPSGGASPRQIWSRLGPATPFSTWVRPGFPTAASARAASRASASSPMGSESVTGSWNGLGSRSVHGDEPLVSELSGGGLLERGGRSEDVEPPFVPPVGQPYYRWVAEVGREAAEALGHAHRRGIIHRDIKPSNLLVDGRGLVWVADFGLARRLSDPGLSRHEQLIGTPRYMSPEQAKNANVDARSDLFSLGATLYELLTLRPPFEGQSAAELVEKIGNTEPAPIRRHDPHVPRDLETIVLKLLAKRPADRYATAADLADDLNRFLRHEPVRARRITPVGRFIRLARRHPGGTAIISTAATVVIGVCSFAYLRVVHERDQAIKGRATTQAAMATVVRMSNVPNRRATGLGLIREAAALWPSPELRNQLRREGVEFLVQRDVEERPPFATGRARALAFGLDGNRLAVLHAGEEGDVFSVWDVAARSRLAGRSLREPPAGSGRGGNRRGSPFGSGPLVGPALVASGSSMATLGPDGQSIRLIDAMTGAVVQDLSARGRRLVGLHATPDGQRLLTIERSFPRDPAQPSVPRPTNETPGTRLRGDGAGPVSKGAGPNPGPLGRSERYEVNLWDPRSFDKPLANLGRWDSDGSGPPHPLVSVAPDGQTVAIARQRKAAVELWATDKGTALVSIETGIEPNAIALGPNSQLAVAGGGEIRIWDAESGMQLANLSPNQASVRLLRFAPRGSLLAAVNFLGREIELWDTAAHAVTAVLPSADRIEDVAFTPDGRTLAAVGQGAKTLVWTAVDSEVRYRLGGFDSLTRSLAFRSDGLLALGTWKGTVRLWNAGRQFQSRETNVDGVENSPQAIAPAAADGGEEAPARERPAALAFDDQGRLITLDPDALRVWEGAPRCDRSRRIPLPELAGPMRLPASLLASAWGGRFLVIGRGGQLLLWRAEDPQTIHPIIPPHGYANFPWARGNDRGRDRDREPGPGSGASASRGPARDRERGLPPGPGSGPIPSSSPGPSSSSSSGPGRGVPFLFWRAVVVAPSGDRLYMVDGNGRVHAWALQGDRATDLGWNGLTTDAMSLALSADGSRLAIGGGAGAVMLVATATGHVESRLLPATAESDVPGDPIERGHPLWAVAFSPNGKEVAAGTQQGDVLIWLLENPGTPLLRLPGHRGWITSLAFDHTGRRLASAGSDRTVDLWDLDHLRTEFVALGLGW